ncbi:MAG: hypothetical protein C0415_00360 [Thermodesulfovibrio sp.]|nr:hypothetical protein [Thermodesulfovibrio sp.]
MKTKDNIAKKGLYIGAGIGLLMFAIIGLLPSSFIGGVLGLKLAGHIFGTPLGMAVLPRIVVGISMVLGVLVTGLVFVVGLSLIGWLLGQVVDVVRAGRTVGIELKTKEKKA